MATRPIRLLHWNESRTERERARVILQARPGDWLITDASSHEDVEAALQSGDTDLLLADCGQTGPFSQRALDAARAAGTPVVLLVAPEDEATAFAFLERGASDYLLKTPLQLRRLPRTLQLVLAASEERNSADLIAAGHSPQRLIIDALEASVALLDEQGCVLVANEAWRRCPTAGEGLARRCEVGANYLALIETVWGPGQVTGIAVAAAIREILSGQRESFSIDYPCHTSQEHRWFRLMASAARADRQRGVAVMHIDVTDRVSAESTVRFQAQLLSTINDAVYATDVELRITAWNPAAETLYGWRVDEVIGRDVREVISPPPPSGEPEPPFTCLESGNSERAEIAQRRRDGTAISVERVSMCIRDDSGRTTGYVTIVRDVTEMNLARSMAMEHEARLQLACRAASEAICDLDLQSGKVWRSEGYHTLFGYREEHIASGLGWWINRIHPEDAERVWQASEAMLANGEEFSAEYRFRRADESYAYVLHRAFILKNSEGDPLRVTGTLIDITERKRTEHALIQSEKRYRLLAENSTDMISRHDTTGRIIYASPAVKTLLGYAPEEMVGKRAYSYIHRDDLVGIRHSLFAGIQQPLTLVYRVRHKNGDYVWFETTARMLSDPADPDAREAICVSRNVTSRKQAEDLLRLQQAELAHISRLTSMGEMASGIAHELNQPLTTISHYVDACQQLMKAGDHSADKILVWTNKIAQQSQRAGDIIRRIKSFVQKTPPERCSVDPARLLEEVIDLLDPDARLHDIQIQYVQESRLPTISVDKVQILQVLVNLLRNAFESLDACQAANRTVTVRAVAPNATEVLIGVEDRGVGISPTKIERLFEPFFTTKQDGTGVGLPISQSIVEDHGGRIWAVNNPDQGMTFWFTLPTATGAKCDESKASRIRRRRRSRSARGAAPHLRVDGP